MTIDVYCDFRSPYAYFASHRIRSPEMVERGHEWSWQPVSIDVLLNLQAGREPWAPYVDPLPGPKRAHLIADVRRLAAYHGLPLRAPEPQRPNSVPALCLALGLDEQDRARFSHAAFDALWQEQRDLASPEVLAACLMQAEVRPEALALAFDAALRTELERKTREAYARGVFGVPTFVLKDDLFFGSDRLDLLLWTIESRRR